MRTNRSLPKNTLVTALALALVVAASFVVRGCSVTESTNIKTSGIWADYLVSQDETDPVWARGTLRVGGSTGTIVDLVGGEYLEVNGTRMTEWVEPITNYHWNTATISPDPSAEYTITFVRTDEQVPTTMVMPEMVYSNDPSTIHTDEQVTVYWDDPGIGGVVDVDVVGDCITNQYHTVGSDLGEFTTSPVTDATPAMPTDCAIEVQVTRSVDYPVNSRFQGGRAEARRLTTLPFSFESTL